MPDPHMGYGCLARASDKVDKPLLDGADHPDLSTLSLVCAKYQVPASINTASRSSTFTLRASGYLSARASDKVDTLLGIQRSWKLGTCERPYRRNAARHPTRGVEAPRSQATKSTRRCPSQIRDVEAPRAQPLGGTP